MTQRSPISTITLSVTQLRQQLFQVLGLVHEHRLQVIVTKHGVPKFAVLPLLLANGRGITIARRGVPIAALMPVREEAATRVS